MSKIRKAIYYKDATSKKEPAKAWIDSLRDIQGQARILVGIQRAEKGNFGKHKSLGAGVMEIKFDFGPGYRVYYALDGSELILLLMGGDKSTQSKDIELAKYYWKTHQEENHGKRK